MVRVFRNRYGIRQLSIPGERKLAFTGAASKFCTAFKTILEEKGFTADEIYTADENYNADETGIYWKCLTTKTLAEEKTCIVIYVNVTRSTLCKCFRTT